MGSGTQKEGHDECHVLLFVMPQHYRCTQKKGAKAEDVC